MSYDVLNSVLILTANLVKCAENGFTGGGRSNSLGKALKIAFSYANAPNLIRTNERVVKSEEQRQAMCRNWSQDQFVHSVQCYKCSKTNVVICLESEITDAKKIDVNLPNSRLDQFVNESIGLSAYVGEMVWARDEIDEDVQA